MFERFSESARAVVVGAQEEAQALGADQILAEHLLLAMLASSEPGATVLWNHGLRRDALIDQLRRLGTGDEDALRSIGVDLEAVRASVEASFGPGALDRTPATPTRRRFRRWSGDSLRFSDPAIRALEGSLRITIELEQNAIGADHVLAALLDDGEPAARTLGRLGIDPVAVRTEVMVGLRR